MTKLLYAKATLDAPNWLLWLPNMLLAAMSIATFPTNAGGKNPVTNKAPMSSLFCSMGNHANDGQNDAALSARSRHSVAA